MSTDEGANMNLHRDIESAINRASAENPSGTPDFILAAFLTDCLTAFDKATIRRGKWRGQPAEFDPTPGIAKTDGARE